VPHGVRKPDEFGIVGGLLHGFYNTAMENSPPILLIACELLEPNRTAADDEALFAELNTLEAKQIQDSLWAVRTELSVTYVISKLKGYFGSSDRLLVAQIGAFVNIGGINKLKSL